MNPNFALDFRDDQIKLLHLQEGVWVQIGVVAVDDPDLEAALSYMRSTALGLSPRGIASKIILPDAAILYTTLPNLPLDAASRAAQIASALVGRTPYAVTDLVYDWTDDGAKAHLAVIARETLDEAEAFANQHRFNPVAFAAWPEQGQFQGEADFGRSATAADFIAPLAHPTPAAPSASPSASLSASDFEMGETASDPVPDVVEVGAIAATEAVEPVLEFNAPPDIDTPAEPVADGSDVEAGETAEGDLDGADVDRGDENIPDLTAEEPQVGHDFELAEAMPVAGTEAAKPQTPADVVQPDLFAPSFDDVMAEEAPMALDVPIEDPIDEPAVKDTAPSPSAGRAQTLLAEFAARREAALGKAALPKADGLGRVEPVLSVAKIAPHPTAPPPAAPPAAATPVIRAEVAPKLAAVAAQNPVRAKETSLGSKPAVKRPAPKSGGKNSALMGFVLTILLLVALALAAALSSYLTTAWNSFGSMTAVAAVQPSVADEIAADLPQPIAPKTVNLRVPDALSDPVSLPVPRLALDRSSSLVPLATPAALPQPIVTAPPNITTASAQTPEAPLITPTAQGVLTPEGVFLIAGRPSTLPQARPATVVSAALQRPAVSQINPTDSLPDPALAGKRPVIRPNTLAPTVANDPALAGKRPLIRPESVLTAGNAAQIALASLAQSSFDAPRSAMAVTISRLPAARPNGLKTTVEASQDLALATPEQIAPDVIAPEANAPLEADNEPEVVAPKSSGSRTVVSKNATFKNAINLSKVNLIGVYGSQANRYALIRQSNGRFKKVYVGDRFDGGMVAAITESELRYSKGGQMLALQMPNG